MSRPKPVLMIPLRRCGSHAIRLRLNLNPDFYAPYPLHIIDIMSFIDFYGDLKDDQNYFQMIVDIIGLQSVSMVKWPDIVFDPNEIFAALKNETRSVHRIVWELLFRAGEKKGAKVVMDKSLDTVKYAHELMNLFDDLLFLNVIRDPRAQISSMNRAIIHDFETYLNAQTWIKAYTAGKELAAAFPDRVLSIRYEDFVTNQESVLKKICSFLGIGFSSRMLDAPRSAEANKISAMSSLWEFNKYDPIPANVDKFKKMLSMEEIALIETITGPFMDEYGYQRITPGKANLSQDYISQIAASNEQKRTQAWENLSVSAYQDYCLRTARRIYIKSIKDNLLLNRERRTGQLSRHKEIFV